MIIILIFSAVIHEVSHGTMANYLGDSTAKYSGRLTLNPIKHLDPIGSVVLPLILYFFAKFYNTPPIIFGWAKPVPINPYNFRDQKYGAAKVAMAGPGANFAIALFFALILRFLLIPAGMIVDLQNPQLTLSNAFAYIVYINLLLAIFNLLPIPPLDGSHILFTFLPQGMENLKIILRQFGLFILLFVIFFLFNWVVLFINWIFSLIVGTNLF